MYVWERDRERERKERERDREREKTWYEHRRHNSFTEITNQVSHSSSHRMDNERKTNCFSAHKNIRDGEIVL